MANSMQKVVIGKRQILRELKKNNIAEIYIAADAETAYITELIEVAKSNDIPYKIGSTMLTIAREYNIDVPCGAVGVLKQ